MKSILALAIALLLCTTTASSSNNGAVVAFDPTDPAYQVNEKFPPNMTATWTYGIEHDGWWIAHQALRGELQDFSNALASLVSFGITQQQVVALRKWWKGHLKHMHSHHFNEDKIAKKFSSQRFRWPDFIEVDHEDVLQRLSSIEKLVQNVVNSSSTQPGEVASHVEKLNSTWGDYHRIVSRHLDQEEEICIALMRAYFNQNQVQRMQQRLAMMGPRVETGAIVYYVGEEYMKESMRMQKTPKLVQAIGWNFILKPRYRFYTKTMVKQLEILKNK
jgi:hypothetical protein